jgi:putative membrane protein
MAQAQNELVTTQELAVQRTEWALERTRLANDRTLIAWLRTGLALLGFGAIVPRLLDNVGAQWLVNLLAVLFVIIGTVIVAMGVHAYRHMTNVLEDATHVIPWPVIAVLAGTIEVAAVLILVLFIIG